MSSLITHDDDTLDEGAATIALLEADGKTKKQVEAERRAPQGFNPAAVFLLDLAWHNLFDPIGGSYGLVYRCKGCGAEVRFNKREDHYRGHKRNAARLAKSGGRTYRDTDTSGGTPSSGTTAKERNDMPAATATPKANKVSKTKVAREAAIAVLTKLGRQATMSEIVEAASKDAKVKSAAVPNATISAQVNFELAEKQPRIVRVARGVYALKGNEKNAMPDAPVKATPKVTPKKAAAAAKATPAKASAGKTSREVRADPKPQRASSTSKRSRGKATAGK